MRLYLARLTALLLAAALTAPALITPALAEPTGPCPSPDRSQERAALLAQLQSSPTEAVAQIASGALWAFWTRAPDPAAQALLDSAMAQRLSYEYAGAEDDLSALVAYCPAFPEGWNQRAFVRFLRQDYDGALADIDQTLALEPAHFGALSGQAQIFLHTGRPGLAELSIRRALKVHPWLAERALLGSHGEDI